MEEIDEQLNNFSMVEVPNGLHQSVMRKLNYQKKKPILFTVFVLLVASFVAIVWHINVKLVDAEFSDMVRDFFDVFSFNFAFISTIWESFFEIISPILVISALTCLLGAIYTAKKISFYQFAKT